MNGSQQMASSQSRHKKGEYEREGKIITESTTPPMHTIYMDRDNITLMKQATKLLVDASKIEARQSTNDREPTCYLCRNPRNCYLKCNKQ